MRPCCQIGLRKIPYRTALAVSDSLRVWDLTLPARHGSFAYLAGVLEAVIGARLNERDLAVPTDVTLAALGGDGALAQSFPTQFARTP